jgi:hypothetical protein
MASEDYERNCLSGPTAVAYHRSVTLSWVDEETTEYTITVPGEQHFSENLLRNLKQRLARTPADAYITIAYNEAFKTNHKTPVKTGSDWLNRHMWAIGAEVTSMVFQATSGAYIQHNAGNVSISTGFVRVYDESGVELAHVALDAFSLTSKGHILFSQPH